MGVYLSEINMPKGDGSKLVLQIFPNGEVYDGHGIRLGITNWAEAVPVPPHGDLVDLKAPFKAQYYDEMTEEWLEKTVTVEDALYGCMVDGMPPTIIPAEEKQL